MASVPSAARATLVAVIFLFFMILLVGFQTFALLRQQPVLAPQDDAPQSKSALQLGSDGSLKIAIFSDLHFGEEEDGWGIDQDLNSTRVMRSVLDEESPAFVVINGDLITGENTFRENSSDYVHQIVAPMVDKNVQWGSVYGNHDSQFNLSREDIMAQEQTYELSYTHSDFHDRSGLTNYWIPIRNEADETLAVLWFLDSRGGHAYQEHNEDASKYDDYVTLDTVDWFKDTHSRIKSSSGDSVPGLVFVHIPTQSYERAEETGINPHRFPGLNDNNPLAFQGDGEDDKAIIEALKDLPKIHSVYTGHVHGNSWCSTWPSSQRRHEDEHSPFLCFAKKTGYGGYGEWKRGARILELKVSGDDIDVETWVRMEDGEIITKVALNSTYGVDEYASETGE